MKNLITALFLVSTFAVSQAAEQPKSELKITETTVVKVNNNYFGQEIDINSLPVRILNFANTKYPENFVETAYLVRDSHNAEYIYVKLQGTDDALFDTAGNFINYK